MNTLTMFFNPLFQDEIATGEYQTIEGNSYTYKIFKDITISGSKLKNCIFEEVIFENCTFFATEIESSLFINCLFINCQFKFATFADCNFESCQFDTCLWGLCKLPRTLLEKSIQTRNVGFINESHDSGKVEMTRSLSFSELASLSV